MISHLGRNPVRGGNPPSDKSIRQVSAASVGDLVQAEARVIVFVELILFKVKKVAEVMIMYVVKAIRVIWGAIWDTNTIHPKWAIDEYARTLRSWVWLRPPHPPTRVEVRAKAVSRKGWP